MDTLAATEDVLAHAGMDAVQNIANARPRREIKKPARFQEGSGAPGKAAARKPLGVQRKAAAAAPRATITKPQRRRAVPQFRVPDVVRRAAAPTEATLAATKMAKAIHRDIATVAEHYLLEDAAWAATGEEALTRAERLRLDALLATAARELERGEAEDAAQQARLARVPPGLAMTVAEYSAIHACAMAEHAHDAAFEATRTLSEELAAQAQQHLATVDALGKTRCAIDAVEDEVLRAPVEHKLRRQDELWHLRRCVADLAARVSASERCCGELEGRLGAARGEVAAAEERMVQLVASVPRALRRKGVAAVLLSECWDV